jgi:heat shock protein HslJ
MEKLTFESPASGHVYGNTGNNRFSGSDRLSQQVTIL